MGRPIIETRVCPVCGKKFGINYYQTRKVYCDGCRRGQYLMYRRQYNILNRDKIRELNKKYKKKKEYKKFTCKLCGKEFQTHRGGVPRYCTPCLEEFKDIYPYKTYYERRMDAECRENWNQCFKDAQKKR